MENFSSEEEFAEACRTSALKYNTRSMQLGLLFRAVQEESYAAWDTWDKALSGTSEEVAVNTRHHATVELGVKRQYLSLLVLSLIQEEEMHGYQIRQEVLRLTHGQYEMEETELYPLLYALEETNMIQGIRKPRPQGGSDRYYFRLTEYGREVLEPEHRTITDLARLVLEYQNG